jgi:hypothetical protein
MLPPPPGYIYLYQAVDTVGPRCARNSVASDLLSGEFMSGDLVSGD